jgi:hypothetical protein
MGIERLGVFGDGGPEDERRLRLVAVLAMELGLPVAELEQAGNETFIIGQTLLSGMEMVSEPGLSEIDHPLSRKVFEQFASGEIKSSGNEDTDKDHLRIVMRVWNGLMNFSRRDDDPERSNGKNYSSAKLALGGVSPPLFKELAHKRHDNDGSRLTLDIKRTDGLDLDQTARYLIAVAERLHVIDPTGKLGLPSELKRMRQFMPSAYSAAGLAILCRYALNVGDNDTGLAKDIDIVTLNWAQVYFAKASAANTENVKLTKYVPR